MKEKTYSLEQLKHSQTFGFYHGDVFSCYKAAKSAIYDSRHKDLTRFENSITELNNMCALLRLMERESKDLPKVICSQYLRLSNSKCCDAIREVFSELLPIATSLITDNVQPFRYINLNLLLDFINDEDNLNKILKPEAYRESVNKFIKLFKEGY